MVSLRKTLKVAHETLEKAQIKHALIGGFALANYGVNRATADIDLIASGDKKEEIVKVLCDVGFNLKEQTREVLHFDGQGYLDILLANRPLSQEMLDNTKKTDLFGIQCCAIEDIIGLKIQAYCNSKKRELQDKADIRALLEKNPNVDWKKIKKYADLFDQWSEVQKIKGSL